MVYCPTCLHLIELSDDDRGHCGCPEPCPCCNDKSDENCVYDTAAQRHLKNLMNGLPDEEWVIEELNFNTARTA